MRYYFELWADAVDQLKKVESSISVGYRIFMLIIFVSIAQGANLVVIYWVLWKFVEFYPFVSIEFIDNEMLAKTLSGFISLFVPFIVFNSVLIMGLRKHEKFLERRKVNTSGQALLVYVVVSMVALLLLAMLHNYLLAQ